MDNKILLIGGVVLAYFLTKKATSYISPTTSSITINENTPQSVVEGLAQAGSNISNQLLQALDTSNAQQDITIKNKAGDILQGYTYNPNASSMPYGTQGYGVSASQYVLNPYGGIAFIQRWDDNNTIII